MRSGEARAPAAAEGVGRMSRLQGVGPAGGGGHSGPLDTSPRPTVISCFWDSGDGFEYTDVSCNKTRPTRGGPASSRLSAVAPALALV